VHWLQLTLQRCRLHARSCDHAQRRDGLHRSTPHITSETPAHPNDPSILLRDSTQTTDSLLHHPVPIEFCFTSEGTEQTNGGGTPSSGADPNIPSTVRALPMPLRPGNELTLPSRSRAITDPFIDPRSGLSPQNSRTASGRGPAPPPPQSRQGVQAQGGDGASPATGRCCTTRSIEVSERERE